MSDDRQAFDMYSLQDCREQFLLLNSERYYLGADGWERYLADELWYGCITDEQAKRWAKVNPRQMELFAA